MTLDVGVKEEGRRRPSLLAPVTSHREWPENLQIGCLQTFYVAVRMNNLKERQTERERERERRNISRGSAYFVVDGDEDVSGGGGGPRRVIPG